MLVSLLAFLAVVASPLLSQLTSSRPPSEVQNPSTLALALVAVGSIALFLLVKRRRQVESAALPGSHSGQVPVTADDADAADEAARGAA